MAPSAVPSTLRLPLRLRSGQAFFSLRAAANSGQAPSAELRTGSIIRATCAFGAKIGVLKQRAGSVSDCVEMT